MMRQTLLAATASLALATSAQAAFLLIDDTDPDTVTVTADGFAGGFFLDTGNGLELFQSGTGNPATVTLPDADYFFAGNWADLGATPSAFFQLLFGLDAGDPEVLSGIVVQTTSDGTFGTILGGFAALVGAPYFLTDIGTGFGQNDGEQSIALTFLDISFNPEPVAASVIPAPAGLGLLGLSLVGLAALRRR